MINLQSLKENPEYRKKVIIATAIFLAMVIGIIIFIIASSDDKNTANETKTPENNIEGNHMVGDSVAIESIDKKMVYNMGNSSENNADDIIKDGVNGGQGVDNAEAPDDDLNNYLSQRQNSIEKMQRGGNNRPISSSSSRRNYNPNGSSSDWTSVNTEKRVSGNSYTQSPQNNDIDAYEKSSASRNIPPTHSTQSNTNSTTTISSLPTESTSLSDEKEKKRLMLRTGKKDITNSSQMKINIDGTQYVRNGQNVKLKLMQDAVISNNFIPKYSILYGIASFGDGRVNIRVNSVKVKDNIIPCSLEGYGTDGNQGIAVNLEAISGVSDVARNEINREIASVTSTRVGSIVSALFSSSRRNEIKVKLLNNHNLIFLQQ